MSVYATAQPITLPRESVEFIEVPVSVDDTPVTAFDVQTTRYRDRPDPTAWATATTVDGKHGVLVHDLAPDLYAVWVKVTDNPEVVILLAGYITIS